jgi:hypothetical protein
MQVLAYGVILRDDYGPSGSETMLTSALAESSSLPI